MALVNSAGKVWESFDSEALMPQSELIESEVIQTKDTEFQRVDIPEWLNENIYFQEVVTFDEIKVELDW